MARGFVGSDLSTGLEVSPSHRITLAGALVWCVFLDLATTSASLLPGLDDVLATKADEVDPEVDRAGGGVR